MREQQSLRRRDGKSVAVCALRSSVQDPPAVGTTLCVHLGSMPSAHLRQNPA